MLKTIKFIKQNEDWENKLSKEPYCITVSRKTMFNEKLMILSYSQFKSDFENEIVRECRGLILNETTLEPISIPFFKFGNYGETYCPNIDWNSAKILTKIDGSLIKIVNIKGNILISTSGMIDAEDAKIYTIGNEGNIPFFNYKQLALNSKQLKDLSTDDMIRMFEEDYTYMFELTSLYNKVVIPYEDINLTFIGIRNNKTLEEEYVKTHKLSKHFPTPNTHVFSSLNDCIQNAINLPHTKEGYVVMDKFFNRVKIKSPAYVILSHSKNKGTMTFKNILKLILENETGEFLTYFPEYTQIIHNVETKYKKVIYKIEEDLIKTKENQNKLNSQKELADFIKNNTIAPSFIFQLIKTNNITVEDFILDKYQKTKSLNFILGIFKSLWEIEDE